MNEAEFIAEVVDPKTLLPAKNGEKGELVLTNLRRFGYPLIRYRTGDLVTQNDASCPCGNPYRFFKGGIQGRVDHMVVIRGVNIFPQSIEAILREYDDVKEFVIEYYTKGNMDQIKVRVETDAELIPEISKKLRDRIGLRIEVELAEAGSLPRYEMKARRMIDHRRGNESVSS